MEGRGRSGGRRSPRRPFLRYRTDSKYIGRALACFVVLAAVALPLATPFVGQAHAAAAPGPELYSGWRTGQPGFITRDGLFFVEIGAPDFIGLFAPHYNGSQLYTYAITVNITSLIATNETARVHLFDYATGTYLTNLSVPMTKFSSQFVQVPMPTEHKWTEVRIVVDGTPGYFYWRTPYTWLPIANLADGGIVLSVVVAFGVYLWISYPLSVKAERMTKRAVYAPEWKATWWLHGLVIGELAFYASDFPQINIAFHGWEVFLFPIPEAIFMFFWSAGRHSRKVVTRFDQPVAIPGRPLSFVSRPFYGGVDPDGNIVVIEYGSKSLLQWWYRSRGKHVKVWSLFEDGRPASRLSARDSIADTTARPARPGQRAIPTEPLTMPVYSYESLTPDQLRDPTRLPRSGLYDQFRGAAVLSEGGNVDEVVSYRFLVPRVSDFQVEWPHATFWRFENVAAYTDEKGRFHPARQKRHLSPHITEGHAQVTLMSWHGQDVYAQALGWMETEDLVLENGDLAVALAVARAQLQILSRRKAEEDTLANRDILQRPETDLEQPELEQLVEQFGGSRRDRTPRPDVGAGGT
jgi:hypothetical protein